MVAPSPSSSLYGLNDVVKPFDLGVADFLQGFRWNVGHAFRGVTLCPIDDLVEGGFDDRTRLYDHQLVENFVFVGRAQTTQCLAVGQNVVANLEIADEIALDRFDICHRGTLANGIALQSSTSAGEA
jgi:hypothetical protein